MCHHRVTPQYWSEMSVRDREKRVNKFILDQKLTVSDSLISHSTDGKLFVKKALG